MSEQTLLTGRHGVGETRDALDRHYTPQSLADLVCDELALLVPDARRILEPSAGGGAFVRAAQRVWPMARVDGVDVDPAAEGLRLTTCSQAIDVLDPHCFVHQHEYDLVLGNPPFTGAVAIEHVELALRLAPVVAFILPWSLLGGVQRWAHIMGRDRKPTLARPIVPRPWNRSIRETALFVWDRRGGFADAEHTLVSPLPRWR